MAKKDLDDDQQVTMTIGEIKAQFQELLDAQKLKASDGVLASVLAEVARSNEKISEALIDSKKPYENPLHAENRETLRRQTQVNEKRARAGKKYAQEHCPHTQGCNEQSQRSNGLSSFACHRLDTGEYVGICTNCQKEISSVRPEDRGWFAKNKGGNQDSAAGVRQLPDPSAAQLARFSPEEREILLAHQA